NTDSPDEPPPSTESRCRDGLIRALTTRDTLKHRIGNRLARTRQPLATGNEIDVRRSHNRYPGRGRHAADPKWSSPSVRSHRRLASAQDAGVPKRVGPRLGPHAQPVGALADGDRCAQVARAGIDRVDNRVVAPAQP